MELKGKTTVGEIVSNYLFINERLKDLKEKIAYAVIHGNNSFVEELKCEYDKYQKKLSDFYSKEVEIKEEKA